MKYASAASPVGGFGVSTFSRLFQMKLLTGVITDRLAETTPGSVRSRLSTSSNIAGCCSSGTFAVCRFACTRRTLFRSNPASRLTSFTRLRRNKPLATNRISDNATCDATIHFPGWNFVRLSPSTAWLPFIADVRDTRVERNAGSTPKSSPVKTATLAVKLRTRQSNERSRKTLFFPVEI